MSNIITVSQAMALTIAATSTRTSMVRRVMAFPHGRDPAGRVMEDPIYIAPCGALAGRLPRMTGPAWTERSTAPQSPGHGRWVWVPWGYARNAAVASSPRKPSCLVVPFSRRVMGDNRA